MKIVAKFRKLYYQASPQFRKRLVILFGILIAFNCAIWLVTFFSLQSYPFLFGLVTIAYGFGLRHAVDADHIAAIDNTTRKLMQDGKRPIGVGFFFSLGHATIVIALSILIAFSASYVKHNLPFFQETGSLIGTTVSSVFLLFIGIINLIALIEIIKIWKAVKSGGKHTDKTIDHLNNRGFFARMLKPLLKTVTQSWHMYPIGLLFGLGFDTASEVGLLSISAVTGASGIPFGYIMLLPLAFTAGMALIDTLDGFLMLGAYGWAYIKPVRKLYYNMSITFISVVIALFIGSVEGLQIISEKTGFNSGFIQVINNLDFANLGYITIAIFVSCWIVSVLVYKWRGYDLLDSTTGKQSS
jgi:high-affinity nickel-transport protein